jgi:hypothetical protein
LGLRLLPVGLTLGLLLGAALINPAIAAKVTDRHGNEGYDTAAECDAAVRAGTAKFYQSVTHQPPLLRAGEASVKSMPLGEVKIPPSVVQARVYGADNYKQGACDLGVGRSGGRDGVSAPLQGKFVPYSPKMMVNVYHDKAGNPVRVTMQQCDNLFGHNFPRPIAFDQPFQCPPQSSAPSAPEPPITIPPAPRQP